MGKENYVKYYMNYPVETSIGVSPYCIRFLDWEDYIKVASKYLLICEDLLRRRLKLGEEWKLLDYVVLMAYSQPQGIEELEKMFSMAFRLPCKLFIQFNKGQIVLQSAKIVLGNYELEDGKLKANHIINRDNYAEIREIMMEQSFLFNPLIGGNEKAQKKIDLAIKRKMEQARKNGKEPNFESMIALNTSRYNIDLETYTYYQMKIQYATLFREQLAFMYNVARPHAKDVPMIEFSEILEVHENPYSFEKMFRQDYGQVGD